MLCGQSSSSKPVLHPTKPAIDKIVDLDIQGIDFLAQRVDLDIYFAVEGIDLGMNIVDLVLKSCDALLRCHFLRRASYQGVQPGMLITGPSGRVYAFRGALIAHELVA